MFFYYYRLFYEIKCKYTKNIVDRQYVFTMKNICRVNKQVQNYKKCLKNSTLGEEKFNFSLGRLLILA